MSLPTFGPLGAISHLRTLRTFGPISHLAMITPMRTVAHLPVVPSIVSIAPLGTVVSAMIGTRIGEQTPLLVGQAVSSRQHIVRTETEYVSNPFITGRTVDLTCVTACVTACITACVALLERPRPMIYDGGTRRVDRGILIERRRIALCQRRCAAQEKDQGHGQGPEP